LTRSANIWFWKHEMKLSAVKLESLSVQKCAAKLEMP
jgi:hypothetical protein